MFETLDPVPSEIATAISDGLNAFNESAEIRREAFAIVWRENGGLVAGITASVSFSVLFIGNLWVAKSLRLGGIGRKLMAAAEKKGAAAPPSRPASTRSRPRPPILPEARICRIRQGQRACGRPARRPDLVREGIFRRGLIRSRWRLPIRYQLKSQWRT